MKNNRQIQLIENKFYLLGFMIGIVPYIVVIIIAIILNASKSFKELLFIFTVLTGFINGYIFKKIITRTKKISKL